ncbi:aminodeoxychorismate/anthranilate synthase component II [Virgibacillus sp. NKC19-3]|uniref:anthranilate synthase component II n=1 Tax=Virgibacillus saliphilus TaxID=2831674 RepID=UPI001C9B801A|nr:aminodeoxychorismate/anthranilate synthase component II [Virgibacillus sp. NKC19-3]MBY7142436.1 aminodeoxychorismate/anthranilate synthase component II [Virgibacillus sp. NKC19-3]
MILVIDNYDSFTFNLVQYIQKIGKDVIVIRNNHVSLENIKEMEPEYILISPGPGNPDDADICLDVVKRFHQEIPILGVCLGQQIIAQAFGGRIRKANKPMHGKTSRITHNNCSIFRDIKSPIQATRYHSLVVDNHGLPECLEITARSEDGEIMGIRHKQYNVEGVQFHPESILTEKGLEMLENFFIKNAKEHSYVI